MSDDKAAATSQPLLASPLNEGLVPRNKAYINVAPGRKRDDLRPDITVSQQQEKVQLTGNSQAADIAQPNDYRPLQITTPAPTSTSLRAYKPLQNHLGATHNPQAPQYQRLEALRSAAPSNTQAPTDGTAPAYRPLQSQFGGMHNPLLPQSPDLTATQEAFRPLAPINTHAPASSFEPAYQELPRHWDAVSIPQVPEFQQMPPYQEAFRPLTSTNMQPPSSAPEYVYPQAPNYLSTSGYPQLPQYQLLPAYQDHFSHLAPGYTQAPTSEMLYSYSLPRGNLNVPNTPLAPLHQYMSAYQEFFSLPQATAYMQSPTISDRPRVAQPAMNPSVWECPQPETYPEPSLYQQSQAYTPRSADQPAPLFPQAFGTEYSGHQPPPWITTRTVFYDTAMAGAPQESPWNMAACYEGLPPSAVAQWPYEAQHWQEDNLRPSPLLPDGTSLRCGAQGCCQACCGDCCNPSDATRWGQEQRYWGESPWLSEPLRLRPCFSDIVQGSARGHHPFCAAGHYLAPPYEAHPCGARPLPLHMHYSGGRCLSRSISWPLIGHECRSYQPVCDDPLNLFSQDMTTAWECPHQPSRVAYEEPSFEAYSCKLTDVYVFSSTTYRRDPGYQYVPETAPPRQTTQRASPTTSWASYSQPPAAPSTVNVQTSVSLGSLQDSQALQLPQSPPLPPPPPTPQPSQPIAQRNMLFKVSTVVTDKDADSTVRREPVTAPSKRSVSTEVELLFLPSSGEKAAGFPVSTRSVSVVTDFPPSQPRSEQSYSQSSRGDSVYYTAPSPDVAAEERLFAPTLPESPERRDLGDSSVSSHGWYQPLHISSQGSRSSSMDPAALSERGSFAAALFLNFAWRAPEGGPLSGSGVARSLPETSGIASVDGPRGTDRFAWSSKALQTNREPTTTHEFKPVEDGLPAEDVLIDEVDSEEEKEEQTKSAASSQPEESPKPTGSARITKSSSSANVLEKKNTNMLRSFTSDPDVAHEEVQEEGHEEDHEDSHEGAHEVKELEEEEGEEHQSAAGSMGKEEDENSKKKPRKKRKRKAGKSSGGNREKWEGNVEEEDEGEEEEYEEKTEKKGEDEHEDQEEKAEDEDEAERRENEEMPGKVDQGEKEDKEEDQEAGIEEEHGDKAVGDSVVGDEDEEQHEEDADEDQQGSESGGKEKKKKKRKKKKKDVSAIGDAEPVAEVDADEEEEEHLSLPGFEKQEKKRKPVPVAVPVSEGKCSKTGQDYVSQIQAAALPKEQPEEEPAQERNSETGVFEAVAVKQTSLSPSSPPPPPIEEASLAAPPKSGLETAAISPEEPLSPAQLSQQKMDEADRDSELMDKEMAELELSSAQLYPESRLVILLAILCLLWIIFVIIVGSVKHGPYPTSGDECTTNPGPPFPPPPWTATWPTPWLPDGSSRGPKPTLPTLPTMQPEGSTKTTEETLHGVFICSTEYCQREGNYLRGLTTQSKKEPCQDFYGHVCGAWKRSFSRLLGDLPGAAVSTDTTLQSSMEAELLAYIKEQTRTDVKPARALYSLCVRRAGAASAPEDVKQLFRQWGSEWPRTDSSRSSPGDVWQFAAKLTRVLGVQSLVGIEIGLDPWNLGENIIEVGPPETIFFSKDISDQRVMALFISAVNGVARFLNPQDTAAADATAEDVRIALTAISALNLEDLGNSPLDFNVDKLDSLGKGVQAFLRGVFGNITALDARSRILVRRGNLLRHELDRTVNTAAPRAMLNYLGLLALVALSPFLPEELSGLRVLHSVYTLGRAEAGSNELMCLRAVGQAYPGCLSDVSLVLHKNTHRSVWLSQLETLFVGFVRDVTWMDNLTSLFVRYKMRHHRLARFFPAWPLGNCSATSHGGADSKAMDAFVHAVSLRQTELLQQLSESALQVSTGSPLAVWPRYRLCLQLFQLPVGLVNGSVPANATFFALHLARLAVRLYAALSQLLYAGTLYEREIPLYFTSQAAETLDDLLDCLVSDAKNKFPNGLSADRVRNALLEQVLALQMSFLAFRRLLTVRRVWRQDFRLSTFPEMSSDQLFFLYYALDNCEISDAVFKSHEFEAHRRLPAAMRVNMALRQSEPFAQAFQCQPRTPMVAEEICQVLR